MIILKQKKTRWGLRSIRLEFNLLVAKIGAVFEPNKVPNVSTKTQRTRIRKEIKSELARIAREEKRPTNVVADTITEIADKERKKAIRNGDYGAAIIAGIVQYYSSQYPIVEKVNKK